jgi:two-component system NarL family response regulator
VLCVDDHKVVREGIALLLDRQPDVRVVASAASVEEAVELYREHSPDVTIMDLQLGSQSGIEAIREIRHLNPDARVIVLSMFHGDEDIFRAIEAGATAYVVKESLSTVLIQTVRDIHAGKPPALSALVQARLDERAAGRALTPRERQVIELISKGMRNKEIADSLQISEETVQVHLKNIFAKLHVQDRTAALTEAVRRGVIHIV